MKMTECSHIELRLSHWPCFFYVLLHFENKSIQHCYQWALFPLWWSVSKKVSAWYFFWTYCIKNVYAFSSLFSFSIFDINNIINSVYTSQTVTILVPFHFNRMSDVWLFGVNSKPIQKALTFFCLPLHFRSSPKQPPHCLPYLPR